MTAPHIRYAVKRDGILHDATICDTQQGAERLGKVYCCYSVKDAPVLKGCQSYDTWGHLLASGRVEIVALECREVGI